MKIKRIPILFVSALLLASSPGAEPGTPAATIKAAKERYEELTRTGRRDAEVSKSVVDAIAKVVVANPTDDLAPDGIRYIAQMAAHWTNDPDLMSDELFEILEKHYLNDERLDSIITTMTSRHKGLPERTKKFLRETAGKSNRPTALAANLFAKALMIEDDAEKEDEYRKLLTEIAENYPKITIFRMDIARHSQDRLSQMKRRVGMEAPEIVGKDVDGKEYKLSDYRGKIVVLSFWGDW